MSLFDTLAFDIAPRALAADDYYRLSRNIGAELDVVGIDRSSLKIKPGTGDYDCTVIATDRRLLHDIAAYSKVALVHISSVSNLENPPFMAFFPSHKSAQAALVQFQSQGLSAEIVLGRSLDGDSETGFRSAKSYEQHIEDYKAGRLQGLLVVGRLNRGFDHPPTSLVVICFATKSRARWVQAVGRASRPFPGKDSCWVLDFGGNFEEFLSPDMSAAEAIAYDNRPPPVPSDIEVVSGGRGETQLNTAPSPLPIGVDTFEGTLHGAMVRHTWSPEKDHPRTHVTFRFSNRYTHREFFGAAHHWWREQQVRCTLLMQALGIPKQMRDVDYYEFESLVERAAKNCNLNVKFVLFPNYEGVPRLQIVKIGGVELISEAEILAVQTSALRITTSSDAAGVPGDG